MNAGSAPSVKDWVGRPGPFLLAWGLPALLWIAGIAFADHRTGLWFFALCWMGTACLLNAARCGRRHCYFTGPFFLSAALATLLHGTGMLSLGANGWLWLGLVTLGGGSLLWWLPERRKGRFKG